MATIGGVRIADRVLDALRAATDEQLVVANDPRAPSWFPGVRVVPDDRPGDGPLAGIATALRAARGAAVLVVAWDMPFVTAALLRELRRRGERGSSVVAPSHGVGPIQEPLCAYYGPDVLRVCQALLAGGERRAAAVLEMDGAESIGHRELERFGEPARLFTSVDTPETLAALGGALPGAR